MVRGRNGSKSYPWMLFIGIFLILIGSYAGLRTIVNLAVFPKYPTSGVLSINMMGFAPFEQREEDCSYPQTYYGMDGKIRSATPEEKEQEKINEERCIMSVQSARDVAKTNDISQSLLFLFLGTGVIIARRMFFR